MSDEVEIQVVEGDEDDPFVQQPDPLASTDSSAGDDEEDGQDAGSDAQSTTTDDGDDDEDAEYTPEQLTALTELQAWREEQVEATAKAATSQLQSKYDRQIAAQNRQIQQIAAQAEARELELKAAVREAQLNGLTDEQKEQLTKQWGEADKLAELDAYKTELTDFHIELLRTAYATEYAEFGLQAEDLESFSTPEEMEAFIKDVQIEYYKLMANPAVQAAINGEAPATSAAAPVATVTRKSPAGSNAPTDAGGGSAPPPSTKFNLGTGAAAMAENIRGGWETPKVR